MIISENLGKWLINAYPPFVFNRIKIKHFGKGYRSCKVRIRKSFLNRNMNGTIFGGSLFSASDPFYAILYWQIFERKKLKVQTWLKSAHIQYLKPADCDLFLDFNLSEQDIEEAEKSLLSIGRYKKVHEIPYVSKNGDVYVIAQTEVYIRLTKSEQKTLSGF
jgi:Domain of unknown function (DUF4442)